MQSDMRRFKFWNNIIGWAVFTLATASFLMTMEPTTSLWDCSEFIATSYKLEVGHPPGAPLYMMLARIASLFAPTPEDVPMMINGMNCVASGFCIMFLFWTITHLARRIIHREGEQMPLHKSMLILGSGAIGAMAYAYTDTFWFSAVEGEVYALSSMFTALVVWLMLKWEENADRPTSMRWIILIAYLMGLSIGVHILNLLTIPALVMIYFFRRYTFTSVKKYILMMLGALALSFVILGAINGIIIPYTVAVGAAFDTFAVNTLGMPVNSGMMFFIVLVSLCLGLLIMFTHRRGYRILNGVALATTVILIGFGSYAMVAIRANANPPMNSNNPSNPHMLLSMLNRDQYGNRPLLYGPYYSARPLPVVEANGDIKSDDQYIPTGNQKLKSMEWYNPTTKQYETREIFDDYVYPSEANKLFPRLWHSGRAKHYENQWVALNDGNPTQLVTDKSGNQWYEPTAKENISYFLDYQLGDMFLRYFMWNFVGRQDDIQLATDGHNAITMHGGWLSGIDAIDKHFTGPTTELPSEQTNNRARNVYFFLPLLLGILGVIYQLSCDWRNFIVVALLYVMMGIALVVYFNTAPNEPRERDYVYSGAFYAFSIWIGLGALSIGHLFSSLASMISERNRLLPNVAVVTGLLMASSVPVVLAAENWDDHDRSGRYYARDIGRNYLITAPKNAILMNYGDNDTFPIWYCQEVEGIRPDVRVMNTSYLGGEWYIDEMKLAANEALGVPFTIPSEKYSYKNEYVVIAEPIDLLMGQANVSLRANIRSILNEATYSIVMPDTRRTEQLTFTEMEQLFFDVEDIISELNNPKFDKYMNGAPVAQEDEEAFAEYLYAELLYEELQHCDQFIKDYHTMNRYMAKYNKLRNADIYLKDAIRLFIHDGASLDANAKPEDRALLLVINDGIMRIVESDSEIPVSERKADFEIMGRINPKADNFLDGNNTDYIIAARNYIIPVDKDAVVESGLMEESERDRMLDQITTTITASYITKDYLMMLDLLANFEWKRPLSFTQQYIMQDYGIANYIRFDGYCYTLVPVYTKYQSGRDAGYLDCDKLYPIFMGEQSQEGHLQPLTFGNVDNLDVYADYFTRYNISAARSRENFARVANEFLRRGTSEDITKAEELLDRGIEVLPSQQIGYDYNNTFPFIRGYYAVGQYYLDQAIENVEIAVNDLNAMLGMNHTAEDVGDSFLYYYDLSDVAKELLSTAHHRGLDVTSIDNVVIKSDNAFAKAEECYLKGDKLATEFITIRGEWAKYYLQFANLQHFSPTVSVELNTAMLDIIDTLELCHLMAGSFDWVANPDKEKRIMKNQLMFDSLINNYIKAVDRLTPTSVNDPAIALIEAHIYNLNDIVTRLPITRFVDGQECYASYLDAFDSYFQKSVPNQIIEQSSTY